MTEVGVDKWQGEDSVRFRTAFSRSPAVNLGADARSIALVLPALLGHTSVPRWKGPGRLPGASAVLREIDGELGGWQ